MKRYIKHIYWYPSFLYSLEYKEVPNCLCKGGLQAAQSRPSLHFSSSLPSNISSERFMSKTQKPLQLSVSVEPHASAVRLCRSVSGYNVSIVVQMVWK